MNKYDLFTYQISPTTTIQTNLFEDELTIESLIANKNKIFKNIFNNKLSFYNRKNKLNYKIEYEDKDFILLRLANIRTIKFEKNFQEEHFTIEPSCLIGFYNDPSIQLIVIESDKTSFGNSFTVLNILEKTIDKELNKHNLSFYPQPKYEEKLLWELFERYEGRIEKLKFEFSKPNLARVNYSLSEELKEASKMLNSETTKVEFEAPKNQSLENLNKDNETLSGMVKSSSEGAGPAKIKLTGVRSWESTENSVKSFSFESLEVEADVKTISKFVEELKSKMKGE